MIIVLAQLQISMSSRSDVLNGIASSARYRLLTAMPVPRLPSPMGWAWNGIVKGSPRHQAEP